MIGKIVDVHQQPDPIDFDASGTRAPKLCVDYTFYPTLQCHPGRPTVSSMQIAVDYSYPELNPEADLPFASIGPSRMG